MITNTAISNSILIKIALKIKTVITSPLISIYSFFSWRKLKQLLRLIKHYYELFNLLTRLYILLHIKHVEHYQPLYNFGVFKNKKVQRICNDRAEAIYEIIKPHGPGAHILDIGCSLGYFSHYFAEREYFVDGIDNNENNIRVCQLLKQVNHGKTQFTATDFSPEFMANVTDFQYDMAFIFSVMHHVVYYKGLEYAQDLMVKTLEKIPVLFIELAVNYEDTDSPWKEFLPDDELSIFDKCKDITIQKIGYFKNHLSDFLRPMYMVQRNTQEFENQSFKVNERKFSSYINNSFNGCKYYDCEGVYIKKYFLNHCRDREKHIEKEIENYKKLPPNGFFPTILSYAKHNDTVTLIFNKLTGDNLHQLLFQGIKLPALSIISKLIKALEFLHDNGIYHNDIRTWNILFDGKEINLLDLELGSENENENTNISLLWIISQLHHFRPCNFAYPRTFKPSFKGIILPDAIQPIVDKLQTTKTFAEFLGWFKQYSSDHTLIDG